jgi:hypothetical protein
MVHKRRPAMKPRQMIGFFLLVLFVVPVVCEAQSGKVKPRRREKIETVQVSERASVPGPWEKAEALPVETVETTRPGPVKVPTVTMPEPVSLPPVIIGGRG